MKRKFSNGKMPQAKRQARKAKPYRFKSVGDTGRSMGPEKKVIDTSISAYGCDTTGTVTLLNGVALGTDYTSRIGRKTRNASLYIRGIITPYDANSGPTLARIIVVYDKQTDGAAPAVGDILNAVNSLAQLNLDNRDRFVVLVDKIYAVGEVSNVATQTFAGAPTVHPVKIYRKIGMDTIFKNTGLASADISTGGIYMVTVGSQPSATAALLTCSTRVRFTDS